ncbi:gephyrin [Trichonephila inaurata madagascariensis]|uniref:molybdopterin molybdotransferase n=1 Tax=Trichonephila inaurata madagascariensis TaxID=2747483 RepID=A0A8X7CQE7_9ARAC|nr:gephyrin [Trichonephila inaurata madagascariensis]
MSGESASNSYSAGILIVSDTVSKREKEDTSGVNLFNILLSNKYFSVTSIEQYCVPDELSDIKGILENWADTKNIDLILTVGGTGFSPRDVTPEATRAVIDREAPHLATHMILGCCKKSKFSVLSRSVCGIRGQSLILNLPGSLKGSTECFEMIVPILSHAIDQLKGKTKSVNTLHLEIQRK